MLYYIESEVCGVVVAERRRGRRVRHSRAQTTSVKLKELWKGRLSGRAALVRRDIDLRELV